MASKQGGAMQIPWYATLFRGDKFAEALKEIAPVALRYGATSYAVYRSRDDQYKFLISLEFDDKHDWERYWYGEEFTDFRRACTSWFTVPLLYVWNDIVVSGRLQREEALVGEDESD